MHKMNVITQRTFWDFFKGMLTVVLIFLAILAAFIIIAGLVSLDFSDISISISDITGSNNSDILVMIAKLMLNGILSLFALVLTFFPFYYTSCGFEGLRLGISRKTFFNYSAVVMLVTPLLTSLIYAYTEVSMAGEWGQFLNYFNLDSYSENLLFAILAGIFGMLVYRYGYGIFFLFVLVPIVQTALALLLSIFSPTLLQTLATAMNNHYTLFMFLFAIICLAVYYLLTKHTHIKAA